MQIAERLRRKIASNRIKKEKKRIVNDGEEVPMNVFFCPAVYNARRQKISHTTKKRLTSLSKTYKIFKNMVYVFYFSV